MNYPFNAPFFINPLNIITPLVNLTIQFEDVLTYINLITDILQIIIQTATFIMKELFYEAFTNITIEKLIYICVVYNLLILAVFENNKKKIKEQKIQIEHLEDQINYLNNIEKIREQKYESYNIDLRAHREYTTNKINTLEKNIKKLEKDLKQYQ
jgi:hypothetical protein